MDYNPSEHDKFLADWMGKPADSLPPELGCNGFWPKVENGKIVGIYDGAWPDHDWEIDARTDVAVRKVKS